MTHFNDILHLLLLLWLWLLLQLIKSNNPNLVLFVGEALVGTEAVDQLTKFNKVSAGEFIDAPLVIVVVGGGIVVVVAPFSSLHIVLFGWLLTGAAGLL